jgi:GntR family transcriptional regulator/MocR family aminotransferase
VFSSLRIGYLVAPTSLVAALTAAKWLCDRHAPNLEQKTLAEFITSGAYARHLRRVSRRNAMRRQALLQAVGRHLGNRVDLTGDGAGAHVVIWPRRRIAEPAVVQRARALGVGIYGLASHYVFTPPRPGFMLGYSRLTEHQIEEGIRRLGRIL